MKVSELSGLKWYQVVLDPGVLLHDSLKQFLVENNLRQAFVLSCVGSCTDVVAVFPKTKEIPPELGRVVFEGLFEMNGISGDVKRDGDEVKVHLHGSFAKQGKEVFGGAIQDGTRIEPLTTHISHNPFHFHSLGRGAPLKLSKFRAIIRAYFPYTRISPTLPTQVVVEKNGKRSVFDVALDAYQ